MFGLSVIDLLKIDIEGAETDVFGIGGPAVLDKVRCCAVELHGAECQAAFFPPQSPFVRVLRTGRTHNRVCHAV